MEVNKSMHEENAFFSKRENVSLDIDTGSYNFIV